MTIIESIYRYPVKGLSAEAVSEANLQAGCSLRDDRRFAIALGSINLDLNERGWMAKNHLGLTQLTLFRCYYGQYEKEPIK